MRPPANRLLPLLALLAALGLLVGGCRDDGPPEPPDPPDSGYHLDPPDLADLLVGELEPGVPVLCYHYFRADFQPAYLLRVLGSVLFGMPALEDREFWTTPRAEFERHLRWFRDTGTRVMTLDEVADLVEAGRPLPARAVVLTIDDADRSVHELAWPLLREYGMRAHLFVPTAKVGGAWSGLDVCTWEQLREMAASGAVIVESHGRDLHYKVATADGPEPVFWHPGRVPAAATAALRDELHARRDELEALDLPDDPDRLLAGPARAVLADLLASRVDILCGTGRAPRWLAWPYGFASADLDSLGRTLGFRGTVSLRPHVVTSRDTTLALGRVALTAKTTLDQVAAVMAAAAPPP